MQPHTANTDSEMHAGTKIALKVWAGSKGSYIVRVDLEFRPFWPGADVGYKEREGSHFTVCIQYRWQNASYLRQAGKPLLAPGG